MGRIYFRPSTSTSPGTASCVRCWHPTAAACGAGAGPSGVRALVVGIYSPVNRCFKSSLALTIGQVMAKKESVLYLNLEEYSGFTRLINSEYKADLSDVLYLYRQEDITG
mgnify:CR=1 FL=1